VVLDETAFMRDATTGSSLPVEDLLTALKPAMATIPGAKLVSISTPAGRTGVLWETYKTYYGKPPLDGGTLVVQAPTLTMNSTIDPTIIEAALAKDPQAAAAEYLAEFRSDIGAFLNREVVEATIEEKRFELPYIPGEQYTAFADAAGGGGKDSFTLAISHYDKKTDHVILDLLREAKPPFSPEAVIRDYSSTINEYKISRVTADRYAGNFVVEQFRKNGVFLTHSALSKSQIYLEFLPLIMAGKVELLDNLVLLTQLTALERRLSRSGRDTVDHPQGAHDDIANAATGAVYFASDKVSKMVPEDALIEVARSSVFDGQTPFDDAPMLSADNPSMFDIFYDDSPDPWDTTEDY
jgi:hypothetical protein